MKLLFFILFFTSSIFAQEIKCEFPNLEWQEIENGVYWKKYDLKFNPYDRDTQIWSNDISRSTTVRILRIDLTKNKLKFINHANDVTCEPLKEKFIQKLIEFNQSKTIAAINASFFDMKNSNVLGLALDANKIWANNLETLTASSSGVFTISSQEMKLTDKKEFIETYGSIFTQDQHQYFDFAIQAYPRLLRDYEIIVSKDVLNSRRSRTALAISDNNNEIYLITLDARGENDVTGMTLYEFGNLLLSKGCGFSFKTALNLDGGGSTSFAIPSLNIYEQADRCRRLGNLISIESR